MHDFEQKYITPSPGPRIIVFNICITPLLAPSVRNMSSGSLSFREDNAHLLVYNLKTKANRSIVSKKFFQPQEKKIRRKKMASGIKTLDTHHAFQ